MILIDPLNTLLGFTADKASLHKSLGQGIELAHHNRIGTATREHHQAVPILGCQAFTALVHPVLAFGLGKRVYVQHGLPLGFTR